MPASLREAEVFIREMRQLGAVRINVGDVFVDFSGIVQPLIETEAEPMAEEEVKRQTEELLYGSSE